MTPAKTHMPGCVKVVPIDSNLQFQPTEARPTLPPPPSKESIYFDYINSFEGPLPIRFPWPDYQEPYRNNYDEYLATEAQWQLDSTDFFNDSTQELIDTTGLSPDMIETVLNEFDFDQKGLFGAYLKALGQYGSLVDMHNRGTDVEYDHVWNIDSANSDAMAGLNAWEALCGIHGDPSCCILIKPDDNLNNWPGKGGGYTHGAGTYCQDGISCPDTNSRYIIFNVTNKSLYNNSDNKVIVNNDYVLDPSAPLHGWFTGSSSPVGSVYEGYGDYSFRQMVEHEIGHFLGMNHPERLASDSSQCINNQTACPDSLEGHPMLMSTVPIVLNNAPVGIQPDDACMFKKLYCPDQLGVSIWQPSEPEPPSPEVYPNPSSGDMTLFYEVSTPCFVQVIIYDVLGKTVREVSSSYEASGPRSILLGTQLLPSGRYVCRVRVGERVSYLNLVITR